MQTNIFPVIDLAATGENIRRLRIERGLTVRDLQAYFGFEEPQAIYKWQAGKSLPTVDNLYALSVYLGVPMERILVPAKPVIFSMTPSEPQCASCGSYHTQPSMPDIVREEPTGSSLFCLQKLQTESIRFFISC